MKDLRYSRDAKKYLRFILLFAIVLLNLVPISTHPVQAAGVPPANDAWQAAISLTSASVPYSVTVDTTGAEIEPDEPDSLTCDGRIIRGGKATIWYTYTNTTGTSQLVSFDTLGSTQSVIVPPSTTPAAYDTYIAVYTGTPSGNPTLVACDDDNDAGYQSQVGFYATPSITYYIQVAQFRGLAGTVTDPGYTGGNLKFHVGYGSQTEVYIGGGSPKGIYTILAGRSERASYIGINNGPVKITSANGVHNIAAERILYSVNGVPTSFVETMGLPAGQLDTTYWLPWYKNVGDGIDTQLRIGNVSGLPASVHVFIGGVEMAGSPFALTASGAGQSTRLSFAGVNDGPVQIVSNVNIVAAERILYSVNGMPTSFVEMMALPNSQLDTTYWLPWYKNVGDGIDTQLRIGVP